jgi:hypothetical protein
MDLIMQLVDLFLITLTNIQRVAYERAWRFGEALDLEVGSQVCLARSLD